jgi:RNA polymerase sigma factor (TIGR02999 family)
MSAEVSLTELIRLFQLGDAASENRLFAAASERLKAMAHSVMPFRSSADYSPSDLVQDTYCQKLAGLSPNVKIENREHFFSIVVRAMKQILSDRSRRQTARKRQHEDQPNIPDRRLHDLSLALSRFAQIDAQANRILRLKMDHGLSWETIAEETGLTVWQVRREHAHAVQWLSKQIR